MAKKIVYVCVKKDLVHPVSWALREFEGRLTVRYFDHTKQLGPAVGEDDAESLIILDSNIGDESTLPFATEMKSSKPLIRILLILSSGTSKEDVVKVIQSKVVSGALMRPFTAEQVSDYIYKLCNFQKPTDVPWYMKTGM